MANVRTNNNGTVYTDAVTDTYTSTQGAKWTLGSYREEDSKGYRFVAFDNGTGNVAAVSGDICYSFSATSPYTVTMDLTDAVGDTNGVMGVFLSVIPDGGYGWIQTHGYHATVKTDAGDDFAEGDAAIAHASTDGVVDRTAEGTAPVSKVVGWALAADVDADDTVALFLCLD